MKRYHWLFVLAALCWLACSGRKDDDDSDPKEDAIVEGNDPGGECVPVCEDLECGDDGCGGSCGNCFDGKICSEGTCQGGPCEAGMPCDDGDPCTYDDDCIEEVCVGTEYECADGKECTSDTCDGEGDCIFEVESGKCLINGICYDDGDPHSDNPCRECDPTVDSTAWSDDDSNDCTDGDECLSGEYCDDGVCVPGGDKVHCDDDNPCTTDSCDSQEGCVFLQSEGHCDDGNECTSNDICEDGQCLGDAADCNDGNPCTDDDCNPAAGCVHDPASGDCDDGDACTIGDFCGDGQCKSGATPLNCDDSNPCTDDLCTPAEGCDYANNTGPCDDDNKCTQNDKCSGGDCSGGVALDCDDGNPCTEDGCDPSWGCTNDSVSGACDDGDVCTEGDSCQGGLCQPGAQAFDCSDGDPCTTDICDPVIGCKYVPNAGVCDDGNECTVNDSCNNGVCGGQVKDCNDNNPCTADGCNPFAPGGCEFTPHDGQCEDGNPCTLGDTCSGGLCSPGLGQLDCDDSNPCTTDSCEPTTGCKHSNMVGFCEDGNPCTEGDYCANGQCISGGSACGCTADADCAGQEDGDLCNGTLHCDKSNPNPVMWSCDIEPGSVVTCNDALNTTCSAQQCVPPSGACVATPTNDGGLCHDGDGCTLNDHCSGGVCTGASCESTGKFCVGGACVDEGCSALSFDGLNDYVDVPAGVPPVLSGNKHRYIELWVYPTKYKVGLVQMGNGQAVEGQTFRILINEEGRLGLDASNGMQFSDVVVEKNKWNFIFAMWHSGTNQYKVGKVKLGQLKKQKLPLSSSNITGSTLWLGKVLTPGYSTFAGKMDMVRMLRVIPGDNSILIDAAGPLAPVLQEYLIAEWSFEEGQGTTAADISGNGYTGTIHGATWSNAGLSCCVPQCAGKECGDDWCGGACGQCVGGSVCHEGLCTAPGMVPVPAGNFWMGCNQAYDGLCDADESPYHEVDVPVFQVDARQVTVSSFASCVDAGWCGSPSTALSTCNWGKDGKDDHPVNCVTWEQAENYCSWAGKRLCTEAEWEKAARGGCSENTDPDLSCAEAMPKYPWGNGSASCDLAVYYVGGAGCGAGGTLPVGSKPDGISPYGLHDAAGNVWDWVQDCYHSSYSGAPVNGAAWETACGSGRVIRGGSFWSTAASIRASSRHQGTPGVGGFDIHVAGIRCCSSLQ